MFEVTTCGFGAGEGLHFRVLASCGMLVLRRSCRSASLKATSHVEVLGGTGRILLA